MLIPLQSLNYSWTWDDETQKLQQDSSVYLKICKDTMYVTQSDLITKEKNKGWSSGALSDFITLVGYLPLKWLKISVFHNVMIITKNSLPYIVPIPVIQLVIFL